MNHASFHKWLQQSKNGRDSVTDEHRPVAISTPSLESRINDIRADRRVTLEIIVDNVQGTVGTVHNNICMKLKYRKRSARTWEEVLGQRRREKYPSTHHHQSTELGGQPMVDNQPSQSMIMTFKMYSRQHNELLFVFVLHCFEVRII
ncbi:hypothetical protein J6590_077209 [Homalodisca vitripennis]|nr:hypothetical protein J6590_077209 [Homalodisca vitripennis]